MESLFIWNIWSYKLFLGEDLIINGKPYNQVELEKLLETTYEIEQPSNRKSIRAFVAHLIPEAGHWVNKTIVNYFKEHTRNKRKITHNKHTKQRLGRDSEKNGNWKKRG